MKILHLSLADWAEAYCGFTPEQEGWAIRLTRVYASREKLIDDDTDNARMMALDVRVWRRAKAFLIDRAGFYVEAGHIKHERIEKELSAYREQRERAVENGRLGGRSRGTSSELPPDFQGTSAGLSQEVQKKSTRIADATSNEFNDISEPTPTPTPLRTDRQTNPCAEQQSVGSSDFVDCKAAFNGSTEAMLAEIENAMGGNCRPNATQWLATLLRYNGQDAVAGAYQQLLTSRANRKPVAMVLGYLSKTAATLKANPPTRSPRGAHSPSTAELLRQIKITAGLPA